jgi:hypothetical protein
MASTIITEVTHYDTTGASTDITSDLVNYKVEENWGESIESADLTFNVNVENSVTFVEGNRITIKRGFVTATDEFVFDGMIIKTERFGGIIKLTCKDMLYEAVKSEVTKSYDSNIDPSAGVISDIFLDLINSHTSLTADGTSVTDTSASVYPKLEKFVLRNDDVFDAINRLANYLNFYIRFDPTTSKVEFKAKGTASYSTILEVGTNVMNVPKWIFDTTEMINKVTIFGASQLDWRKENFNGDGSTEDFEVASKPGASEVTVGGVLQTKGIQGSTGSFDYKVDEERSIFSFETAPVLGVNNIVINYETQIPVPVTASAPISIATWGGPDQTPTEKTFYEKDIITIDDALERANSILNKYSEPFISTELLIKDAIDFEPGMLVDVVDSINGENRSLMVHKITMTYPYNGDKLNVGDKELKIEDWDVDLAKRVRDIQREMSKNIDLLIHASALDKQIKFKRASLTIQRRNIAGISGIYGSATQGIYGQSYYGSSGMVWGSNLLGTWGQVNWGNPFTSFVLGHSIGAVLGTSKLGADNPLPWQTLYTKTYGATEGY